MHLDEIHVAMIMGVFVIAVGCFLASVVWRLYMGGGNHVDWQEQHDDPLSR